MVLPRNLTRQSVSNCEGRCAIHGGCRSVNTAWLAIWHAVAGSQLAHAQLKVLQVCVYRALRFVGCWSTCRRTKVTYDGLMYYVDAARRALCKFCSACALGHRH